jgi:nitroimidazol reductase NimA-like FMN-containing flavoprotein (pyridoxamine 5'-phosphate oxidase superfamily)
MTIKEQMRDDVFKFLQENSTAVIATSYKNDPRASTVYFVIDEEFNFYFITRRNTDKYLNSELNPKAAVVVGTGPAHISVQAHGEIELIVNDEEREKILKLIQAKQSLKNTGMWPIEHLEEFKGKENIIYKIIPDELFYMNLDSPKHPDTVTDEYMKIIP